MNNKDTIHNHFTHLSDYLGENYSCSLVTHSEEKSLIKVRTPFTYEDGEIIDLLLSKETLALSDIGETLRWITSQCPYEHLNNVKLKHLLNSYLGVILEERPKHYKIKLEQSTGVLTLLVQGDNIFLLRDSIVELASIISLISHRIFR